MGSYGDIWIHQNPSGTYVLMAGKTAISPAEESRAVVRGYSEAMERNGWIDEAGCLVVPGHEAPELEIMLTR